MPRGDTFVPHSFTYKRRSDLSSKEVGQLTGTNREGHARDIFGICKSRMSDPARDSFKPVLVLPFAFIDWIGTYDSILIMPRSPHIHRHRIPFNIASPDHHIPFVVAILGFHKFPLLSYFLRRHFPRSAGCVTTSQNQEIPLDAASLDHRTPFGTASLRTTTLCNIPHSLRRLFPRTSYSLPFVAASIRHTPVVTPASLRRPISFVTIFPLLSHPFVTTALGHHTISTTCRHIFLHDVKYHNSIYHHLGHISSYIFYTI